MRIALRNVLRQKQRSALSLLAVAAGVAGLMLARGFIDWNLREYRESAIRSQYGHLQVHKKGYSEAGSSDPFSLQLAHSDAERRWLETQPGVRVVAARLALTGLASHGESTLSFVGEGVEPENEAELSEGLVFIAGHNLVPGDLNAVVIGQGLASSLGVGVGSTVVLLSNTRNGGINAAELTVKGVFSGMIKAYDDVALRLPLATAHSLLRTQGVHSWMALLEDTARTPHLLEVARDRLAPMGMEVVPWWDLADFYNKSSRLLAAQSGVMKGIIAALILLTILNTLSTTVVERTREIGTCLAIGTKRRSILGQFVLEGALIGLIGGALGVACGLILAQVVSMIGIPLPPPPGMARGLRGGVAVSTGLAIDALLLALLSTLLASIAPAYRASRLPIVDALRHRR